MMHGMESRYKYLTSNIIHFRPKKILLPRSLVLFKCGTKAFENIVSITIINYSIYYSVKVCISYTPFLVRNKLFNSLSTVPETDSIV